MLIQGVRVSISMWNLNNAVLNIIIIIIIIVTVVALLKRVICMKQFQAKFNKDLIELREYIVLKESELALLPWVC